MKRSPPALLALLLLGTPPVAIAPVGDAPLCRPEVTAFVGVDVATMSDAGTLRGQTVIVRDGIISAIGDRSAVTLPHGANIVQGNGRFLTPGLTDAHVHLNVDEDRWMPLFVANGVTTVFNQRGGPEHLLLRSAVAECKTIGPTIYTAGLRDHRSRPAQPDLRCRHRSAAGPGRTR